jgi:hypothetical protein
LPIARGADGAHRRHRDCLEQPAARLIPESPGTFTGLRPASKSKAAQRRCAMTPRDIDPSGIDWSSGKYEGGRRTAVHAEFALQSGERSRATFRATPEEARRAIEQLLYFAGQPSTRQAAVIQALLELAAKPLRGARHYAVEAGIAKISAAPEMAMVLLEDLAFWQRNPKQILASVVATFFSIASDASRSSRGNTVKSIRAGILLYGPWIHSFAIRLTPRSRSHAERAADDRDWHIFDRVMQAATSAGYERRRFLSTRNPKLPLRWPLQAFMLEYCLGGRSAWQQAGLITPLDLVERMIAKRQDRDTGDRAVTGIYQHYLGPAWRSLFRRAPRRPGIPRPIKRLIK